MEGILRTGEPAEVGMSATGLEELEEHFQRLVEQGKLPGAVYLVVKNGVVAAHKGVGFRQLVPEKLPMTTDTWFDFASLTKLFFATLVMQYVDRGLFSLSERLSDTMTDLQGTDKEGITVWNLLTHSSGLSGILELYKTSGGRDAMIEQIMNSPLKNPVGTYVEYSCVGFILLEEWIRRRVGNWKEQMEKNMFLPLGIRDIGYGPIGNEHLVAATEYCPWRGRYLVGEIHDENAYALGGSANAGLFGTAWSLGVFGQSFLNKGKGILSEETIRLMCSNHTKSLNQNRGLGWQMYEPNCSAGELMSPTAFGHTGFTGTSIWIDPEHDVVAVLLTNRVHPSRDNQHIFAIRQSFHNQVMAAVRAD